MTAHQIASRFLGIKETPGVTSTPIVLAMLKLDHAWPAGDDVAWCSAFVNFVAWLLDLPRSRSLAARSWLTVGAPVALEHAVVGFDVVVLKRGAGAQPGPEVTSNASGHVGFYAGKDQGGVWVLGGNQSNAVTRQQYPASQVLGVRRLA